MEQLTNPASKASPLLAITRTESTPDDCGSGTYLKGTSPLPETVSRNSKVPCFGGQAMLYVKGLFSRSMAVRDPTMGWSCTDVAFRSLMMGGSGTRMMATSREAVAWGRGVRAGGGVSCWCLRPTLLQCVEVVN